ncbi:MAG: BsuBI/PstI family type II restriction endonuclease [Candidatus Binatus sp.]|uniref:BsuBI/PstI family type II restriction endonuclease n=1 Tax=Candidatus Binatus sp. TaxID=2811406 RepID=UPI002727F144|nr:BsuBI/PstI family type II restriction endonuclease [Candidatus Binatus sp.]MDO8434394.1 BsuBI/PstI family type II restriction endonuclease [Candidatus Binatus sp.]
MPPSKKAIRIAQAGAILKDFGLPAAQQNQISSLTLLALCGLRVNDPWSSASREARTVTKGIMDFISRNYRVSYAPNTRETVRRQVLHQFVLAGLANYNPFEPELPTNSPRAHYAVSEIALEAIRSYGAAGHEGWIARFLSTRTTLIELFERRRSKRLIPITFPDGISVRLSPGAHNKLQKAIVEQFAPQFVQSAKLLYLGDTAQKNLYHHAETLNALRIPVTEHDKLPDVIIFDEARNWIFLVEAVTSHGPMSNKRVLELEELFRACPAGLIYVSAFPDLASFRRHVREIAWDTEVWIADLPEHLIHYNGDRFLGPR